MLPEILTEIPGPESRRLAVELRRYESRNVTFVSPEFPVFWERAAGANVWDVDGNRFLDLTSAFAVTGLGHTHPAILEAAQTQSAKLMHAMGDVHPTAGKAELCRILSEVTYERWGRGIAKTLLGNSGSDAVEAALKTALLVTGKSGVISFTGGYHGLGHGALETVGIPYFRTPFQGQLAAFGVQLPYWLPSFSAERRAELRRELQTVLRAGRVGAILVEPIQGRGGEVVPSPDFLPTLRELADAEGVVLIHDEIYTGFNRTGRLFAGEHFGVTPDLICLGKGMASGFPISACVGPADLMDAWPESSGEALHTSTFLGNPVGCAMALAAIREHRRPETAVAVETSARLWWEALSELNSPHLETVRGRGLMLGLEMKTSRVAQGFMLFALQRGVLVLAGGPEGNVISLTPPFSLTEPTIRWVVAQLQEYLTSLPGSIS